MNGKVFPVGDTCVLYNDIVRRNCDKPPQEKIVTLIGLGMAAVAAPAALSIIGCGGKSGDGGSSAPADSFSVTSTPDATSHAHSVTIPLADLATPPANDATYTSNGSHVHTITLTQQQLTDINSGQTVSVVSSVSEAHTHTWAITKP
ncbi:MAG: hypothetical protein HZC49_08045 [Nitrospirae bacterium]|nr:hypothetical protein [Nitrospirota bacterium]